MVFVVALLANVIPGLVLDAYIGRIWLPLQAVIIGASPALALVGLVLACIGLWNHGGEGWWGVLGFLLNMLLLLLYLLILFVAG